MLSKKKKEILDLWKEGHSLLQIHNRGYNVKLIDSTIDNYTRKNAKKWLKEK